MCFACKVSPTFLFLCVSFLLLLSLSFFHWNSHCLLLFLNFVYHSYHHLLSFIRSFVFVLLLLSFVHSLVFVLLYFILFSFVFYIRDFLLNLLLLKWQPNHLHLLLVSSNWRNSSPVLCVLTSIPTLRPYLVYTLSVRPVLRGFLKIRRVRPITSLVPLVVIVQSYQEEEQEPFL